MNKTLKYIVLLAIACFVGKASAQELKSEVFSILNLDYPGLEKVKALHQEGKDEDTAKALLDYYRARTNVKTPDINLNKVTINNENVYSIPLWEQSDAMVVSGSFLRCRNIGLSWQMKREWCEKIYMKNLSLNFNMDNIFVIASKRFNGFDPEVSNSVLPRNYSLGINIGF